MLSIPRVLASLLIASLVGCASTPQMQQSRPVTAQSVALGKSALLAETNHTVKALDADRTILYTQNRGGSLGVGLLLGPLGVAANIKAVEGLTDQEAARLSGKFVLKPIEALTQAAGAISFPLASSSNGSDSQLTPFVQISKTDETIWHVSAHLLLEGASGSSKWIRRYQYQLPGSYTLEKLASLDAAALGELQASTKQGYTALLKHIQGETDASVATEQKAIATSAYLTPNFVYGQYASVIRNEGERVWLRTVGTVVSMETSGVKIEIQKN